MVTFNLGAAGTVTAATATQLTVTFSTQPSLGNLTAVVTTSGFSSGVAVQVASVVPVVTSSAAALPITTTTLTINGAGFSATPAQNVVTFNLGAAGTVTAATTTQLTITFTTQPTSVGNLTAVVTTNGFSSGAAVQVATVIPVVTANATALPITATTITINGAGFDTTPGNNTVVFDLGAVGTVTAATTTQLTVTFSTRPTSVGNLTAVVTANGFGSGAAVQVATVIPVVTGNATNLAQNAPTILIAGVGFSTTPGNNVVTFNLGAVGTVTAATATQLTVSFTTQPTATGSLTAVDTTSGLSSGPPVQVATVVPAPTITSSTAQLPQSATTIIITGGNFSPVATDNVVTFNLGAIGTVTAATATQLTVTFTTQPSALGALTAVISLFGGGSGAPVQVATVVTVPAVTVSPASSVTATTATLGGNVTSDGGAPPVTARGVVYALTSVNPNPTIGGTGVTVVNASSAGTGVFNVGVSGLAAGRGYSFVAFATNSVGTRYSPVASFKTQPSVSLSESGSPFSEFGGSATVTATLNATSNQAVTIPLSFGGTAPNSDYTASANSITIPAGKRTGSITLTGANNPNFGTSSLTVTVGIAGVTNGLAGIPSTVSLTVGLSANEIYVTNCYHLLLKRPGRQRLPILGRPAQQRRVPFHGGSGHGEQPRVPDRPGERALPALPEPARLARRMGRLGKSPGQRHLARTGDGGHPRFAGILQRSSLTAVVGAVAQSRLRAGAVSAGAGPVRLGD